METNTFRFSPISLAGTASGECPVSQVFSWDQLFLSSLQYPCFSSFSIKQLSLFFRFCFMETGLESITDMKPEKGFALSEQITFRLPHNCSDFDLNYRMLYAFFTSHYHFIVMLGRNYAAFSGCRLENPQGLSLNLFPETFTLVSYEKRRTIYEGNKVC